MKKKTELISMGLLPSNFSCVPVEKDVVQWFPTFLGPRPTL
jgi:hypothetical protein